LVYQVKREKRVQSESRVKPDLPEFPVRPVCQVKLVKKVLKVLPDLKANRDPSVHLVYLDSLVNAV